MSDDARGYGKWEFLTIALVILSAMVLADRIWGIGAMAAFLDGLKAIIGAIRG